MLPTVHCFDTLDIFIVSIRSKLSDSNLSPVETCHPSVAAGSLR